MSYPNGVLELRALLGDTASHKRSTFKRLLGNVDGSNTEFTSYDKRIVSDTLVVYVNRSPVGFELNDAVAGDITIGSAPAINDVVEGTYYWQWWLDSELQDFLNKGAEQTGVFTDVVPDNSYLAIQAGLRSAALNFAASFALKSLLHYLVTRKHSSEFLVEQDGNDDDAFSKTVEALDKLANQHYKDAIIYRDDFYKRQGRRNAPAFGVKLGITTRYGSNR